MKKVFQFISLCFAVASFVAVFFFLLSIEFGGMNLEFGYTAAVGSIVVFGFSTVLYVEFS